MLYQEKIPQNIHAFYHSLPNITLSKDVDNRKKLFVLLYLAYYNTVFYSGRGAVWLARLTGGQEVAGSSPVAPICSRLQVLATYVLFSV